MICKDCIHYDRCKGLYRFERLQKAVSKGCPYFKDRSRFVEPIVGKWIYGVDYFNYPVYRCSNCREQLEFEEGTPADNDYRFCPFCGAKMEEAEQALKERDNDA